MTAALLVCFGNRNECVGCGGWVHAGPPLPDGEPGPTTPPFEAPEDSRAPGRYCSEDCWEEWEEHLAREAERWQQLYGCCSECGFDRQEHDEGCSLQMEAS